MTVGRAGQGGRLVELDEEACWALLGAHSVARVAWCAGGAPHVVPVTYGLAEGRLWVRSSPWSALVRESRGHAVAVEVDEVDEATRSGASVVVEGRARAGIGPGPVEPWPEGNRPVLLSIDPARVTGRRLLPGC